MLAAASVPTWTPPPPRTAAVGEVVALTMIRDHVRVVAVVADNGTIDTPLCGTIDVVGSDAAMICRDTAQCLSQYFRRAALQVTIGDGSDPLASQSGCAIEGPARPQGIAPQSQRVVQAMANADRVDPRVLSRAADAAATLEGLLAFKTAVHPEVVAAMARVQALADVALTATATEQPTVDDTYARRLSDASLTVQTLQNELGANHPDLRAARAIQTFWATLVEALTVPATAPTPAQLAVGRSEVSVRLADAQRRYGPSHPTLIALQQRHAQLDALPTGTASCDALRHAFDLRIARLEGEQSTGKQSTRDASVLDAVVDALAIARARLVTAPPCAPPVVPAAPPP